MSNKELERLISETVTKLGLSKSFISSSTDTVEMLSLLSNVDKESIVKVFEAFLLYYMINFIESPHQKCNIPFLGQLSTNVYERQGKVTQASNGEIVEAPKEIVNEVHLYLLAKLSDDIKNIKYKTNKDLNLLDDLTNKCVELMEDKDKNE